MKVNNCGYYDEGRTTIAQLKLGKTKYTIVNVYAPTNPTQRHCYFNALFSHLEIIENRNNLIIAGDFNITLEEIDIQGERGKQRIGRPELKNIIDTFLLKDAFRIKNPNASETTFENKTHCRSARLDRLYLSNNIPMGEFSVKLTPLFFSTLDVFRLVCSIAVVCKKYTKRRNSQYFR